MGEKAFTGGSHCRTGGLGSHPGSFTTTAREASLSPQLCKALQQVSVELGTCFSPWLERGPIRSSGSGANFEIGLEGLAWYWSMPVNVDSLYAQTDVKILLVYNTRNVQIGCVRLTPLENFF